ncbi:MAG: hypothetical protein CMQ17_00030 [Gammaproteobacteria bacterium]|nr:hypothetical protein [Gammaproteobacteria bacterium]
MKLTDVSDQFKAMGINVATVTYDSVELLKEVQEDQDINFTLLHDEGVEHVNALGIRNLDYDPGDRAYGIPYPGIFLLDQNGVIRFKFAEEGFVRRPDFEDVLAAAGEM